MKRGKTRSVFSYLARRTVLVISCLVFSAVSVGVLYYAQAGLLFRPEMDSRGQTALQHAAPKNSPAEPKDRILGLQEPITAPESPSRARPEKTRSTSCDEKAKQAAKLVYERALDYETMLHEKNSSEVGRLSKLFSPLFGDKTKAENTRHEKAVVSITDKYQQVLASAHCKK